MTGYDHLEFAIEATGSDDDPTALLERVGLSPTQGRRQADSYSKGIAQRLTLAIALVGEPDLLILDEPTTGLDPGGARRMREIIQTECERGATVFFSSHILAQVEAVCDRVGILREGQLVTVDSIEGLRRTAGTDGEVRLRLDGTPADVRETLPDRVRAIEGVGTVDLADGALTITCADDAKARAIAACLDAGATVADVQTSERSLEDLFVAVTGDER
jgi:ABC-2 type transport system ATP-binding protein